jgi:hypothetical protein
MLGSRLEEISAEEQFRGCQTTTTTTTLITDESIQRQLLQEDEEEDFLDEGWFDRIEIEITIFIENFLPSFLQNWGRIQNTQFSL